MHAPVSNPQTSSKPVGGDPWPFMVALLQACSDPDSDALSRLVIRNSSPHTVSAVNFQREHTVKVIEELANAWIVLSWLDPTQCRYSEQTWVPSKARHSGLCALSGRPVKRGDRVYKPRLRGEPAPLNGDAMILPSALQLIRER